MLGYVKPGAPNSGRLTCLALDSCAVENQTVGSLGTILLRRFSARPSTDPTRHAFMTIIGAGCPARSCGKMVSDRPPTTADPVRPVCFGRDDSRREPWKSEYLLPKRSWTLIWRGRTRILWRGRTGSQIPQDLRDQSGCERSVWVPSMTWMAPTVRSTR